MAKSLAQSFNNFLTEVTYKSYHANARILIITHKAGISEKWYDLILGSNYVKSLPNFVSHEPMLRNFQVEVRCDVSELSAEITAFREEQCN